MFKIKGERELEKRMSALEPKGWKALTKKLNKI